MYKLSFNKYSLLTLFYSEAKLSCWTNLVEEERNVQLMEAERIVGGLFETSAEKNASIQNTSINMTSPEISFISILRYGMLALELLPENSSAGK